MFHHKLTATYQKQLGTLIRILQFSHFPPSEGALELTSHSYLSYGLSHAPLMGPRSMGFTVRWHFPAPKAPKAVLFIDFLLVGMELLTVKTAQLDKIPKTTPLYLAKGADAVTQSLHLQGSIMHFSHHRVATMIGEDTVGWEGLSRSGITEIPNECSLQVHGLNSGHHYTHKPSGLMCVCNQKQ